MVEKSREVILIVGNRIQTEYVDMLFVDTVYRTHKIMDGKEALDFLLHEVDPSAVILISYQLPTLDGLAVMQRLQRAGKELACVFLTADKTVERAIEAMKGGAVDFIPKTERLQFDLLPVIDKAYEFQQNRLEQQRIKAELHESQEKLRATMESMDDLVMALDQHGQYIDIHLPPDDSFSFIHPDAIVGQHFNQVDMPGDFNPKFKPAIQALLDTGQAQQFDFSFQQNSGIQWFTVKASVRKSIDGTFSGVTIVARDITERKLSEIILKESEEQLKIQNAEIQRKNAEIENQRDIARKQRDELAQQQRKITDSILYAKRIQSAILPPQEFIYHVLPEHFIFFKPRDIVSGDFYWMTQRDNRIFVVAADCTGHGVPGAFMSMLGIVFFNEIVNKAESQIEAAEILNQLRTSIIKSLRQTGKRGEAADGMDVALCILDLEHQEIQYAGANNPLYLIRPVEIYHGDIELAQSFLHDKTMEDIVEGEQDPDSMKFIELKPDKMPISIHRKADQPFTNNKLAVKNGDQIYLFTDGFVDQFGGDKGRKFLSRHFKDLLISIHEKPFDEQHTTIEDAFINWKGERKQLDDVLVIGFKVALDSLSLSDKKYSWKDKVILIVEDEEHNFVLLEEILETTRAKILRAHNGKEAVQLCKEGKQKIDMILMDIQMPVMNGYEAIQLIKQHNKDLPIIVQTAYTMSGEKEKSFKAGCDNYVAKPINANELLATISKYI